MDTTIHPTAPVVVGYDGSPGAELALDWAYDHARLEQRPLDIFHATGSSVGAEQPVTVAQAESVAAPRTSKRQRTLVEDAAQRIRGAGDTEVRTVLHHGGARSGLVGASRDAAVVVVGATSQGAVASMLLGSVAQGVAKGARCPVVIVRRSHSAGLRSVLVGTDCDPRSDAAVAFAFRVAAARSCRLTVLRCFWDATRLVGDVEKDEAGYEREWDELAAAISSHADRYPEVEVHLSLSRGFADRRLIKATHDHDLVVIGHHRMPLLDTVVWGNVTPVVVREAVGDVAVVPADVGHVDPA